MTNLLETAQIFAHQFQQAGESSQRVLNRPAVILAFLLQLFDVRQP